MASAPASPSVDVDSHVRTLMQQGDWTSITGMLQSGEWSDRYKVRVIMTVATLTEVQQLSQHVLPFCSSAQLDSAMANLISAHLWADVYNLAQCAGHEHLQWQIGRLSVSSHLLVIIAKGRWKDVGDILQDLPADEKHWALGQASQRAGQLEIIQHVLPQCGDVDADGVLKELASRGQWWAVGSLFRQDLKVSHALKDWAIQHGAKEATTWELSDFILPHCNRRQLLSVSTQLVTRRLWWALGLLLKKDVHMFSQCILSVCRPADSDLLMSHLISVGQWQNAQKLLLIVGVKKYYWQIGDARILGKHIEWAAKERWGELAYDAFKNCSTSVLAWAMEEMSKRAEKNLITAIVVQMCPFSQIPSVLQNIVKRDFMVEAARLLCRLTGETLEVWAGVSSTDCKEDVLLNLVRKHHFDLKRGANLFIKTREEKILYGSVKLFSKLVWNDNFLLQLMTSASSKQLLCQVLFDSALRVATVSLCDWLDKSVLCHSVDDQVQWTMTEILKEISANPFRIPQITRRLCVEFKTTLADNSTPNPVFILSFIGAVLNHCFYRGEWSEDTETILHILTTVPVVPDIQKEALRIMLKEKKWPIIGLADLSYVGEGVRRLLFSAAVKEKQWGLVQQWADHTLNDDQRNWALKKALQEKQWKICLRLAEHGLTEDELSRVYYQVALHADWALVLELFKQGADIVEVRKLLSEAKMRMGKGDEEQEQRHRQRMNELESVEIELRSRMVSLETLESAVKHCDWPVVLLMVHQKPTADNMKMALKAAVAGQAWCVVMNLIRLGIHTDEQNPFLLEMIRNQQWGVCGAMIDEGLNTELYVDLVSQLLELNQWSLVGNMMDHQVDDAVRRQVIQRAFQRGEGTVVSQSIKGMEQQLSSQERHDLFHRAIINDALQAVKPLVTEKDDIGIEHRNVALLYAINQQQWDVVDHCLHHHADINLLDETGISPIHTAAQRNQWEKVLALAKRGADISGLDSTGLSVLHTAIKEEKWEYVKSLILFCPDLQQCARHEEERRSVLEMLIDACRLDLIVYALSHSANQWKGVDSRGETTLHTCCLSGDLDLIRPLLQQGAQPLSVTSRGHSVLSYAVLARRQPQKVVARCISVGLSTHQPHISSAMHSTQLLFLSPILLAVMRGLPVTTRMLYESGSCSCSELFRALPSLLPLTDPITVRKSFLMKRFLSETRIVSAKREGEEEQGDPVDFYAALYGRLDLLRVKLIGKAAQYLIDMSSTPRSLKSMCRLVISHSLGISAMRDSDVSKLPIPNAMKEYILSDLSLPHYGHDADDENPRARAFSDESWFLARRVVDELDSDDEQDWEADEDEVWYPRNRRNVISDFDDDDVEFLWGTGPEIDEDDW